MDYAFGNDGYEMHLNNDINFSRVPNAGTTLESNEPLRQLQQLQQQYDKGEKQKTIEPNTQQYQDDPPRYQNLHDKAGIARESIQTDLTMLQFSYGWSKRRTVLVILLCVVVTAIVVAGITAGIILGVYSKDKRNELIQNREISSATTTTITTTTSSTQYTDLHSTESTTTTTDCPPDFTYSAYTRLCYKIVAEKNIWNESHEVCRQLHPRGRLIVLENRLQQLVIHEGIAALSQQEMDTCTVVGTRQFYTSGQRTIDRNCTTPFVWKPNREPPFLTFGNVTWAPR